MTQDSSTAPEVTETASSSKPLVLVDGSSFLFRAFHALPPLTAADGTPTGALHGVVNMLMKLRREESPKRMAVVFDAPGPTFRDELSPDYKAHRPPAPEDLVAQIEPVHQMVRALGFPLLCISGVEADDVIGTLVHEARGRGEEVLVATADKDFAQLLVEGIRLVNTMSGTVLDAAAVEEKYGIRPDQFIDYLTLVGDKVDNIPGVPGCGPKTAAKWLNQWGTLDALMAHADEVGGKIGEALRASLEFLPLSRQLATIKLDCDLPLSEDQLALSDPDVPLAVELAERYGLNTLRRNLLDPAKTGQSASSGATASSAESAQSVPSDLKVVTVLDEETWADWLKKIQEAPLVGFDTESTSLSILDAEVVGLSFAVEAGEAAYVPLQHDYLGAPEQLNRETVLEQLRTWLGDPKCAKVMQNAKYDTNVLANHDLTLAGVQFDTMLESYVMDSTATRHDMDTLAQHYLGQHTIRYEDVAGKGAKALTFNQVDVEQAAPYAAEDADVTLRLHQSLWPRLEAEKGPAAVFRDIEMPLIPVLAQMERTGVRVDRDRLAEQGRVIGARIDELERQAHEVAGRAFNLGSPKQLKELLFDELGLRVTRKTAKGEPSTNEDALSEIRDDHELPALILDWRGLSKLKSTYIDRLPEEIHPKTKRVHSSFHQAVTATGRLSSSNPNLQNIPIRSEEGRRIRQAFVADPGHKLISADYSQIELRIMAHLSRDPGLIQAFEHQRDIHRATAAEVFGVKESEVSDNQRRAAKAINFGLIYGMSAFGLARQIGVERGEAQAYIDRYFERYPGVAEYMDKMRALAHEQGYVETVYGRRLYLPDINHRNGQRRQYAERTAINAPMQGTAADIIKRAMIDLHAKLVVSGKVRMILQVHDELVFEVPESDVAEISEVVQAAMVNAADLDVVLEVGMGVGDSWADAH